MQAPAKHYKLVFSAKNSNTKDVIAIDDILIQDRACDTTYVQIHGFSQLLAEATPGSAVFTDTLYTDDGYAFLLKIYPQGREPEVNYPSGYMSIYVGLVPGVNDDDLEWPFVNRHIRVQMEDQDPDVVVRMNQFSQYLTEADNGDGHVWDRPVEGVEFSQYGFGTFMLVSDIVDTKHFLKNDAVVISVQIRDMNNAPQRGYVADVHANTYEEHGNIDISIDIKDHGNSTEP